MDIEKLDINAVCFGILCNFTPVCGEERAKEAVELVRTLQAENEKLRADLEQVKQERDAAIRDLEMVSVCDTCAHEHAPSCLGCNDAENWEWRGPEEESK
ncbi:hypothetical protein ADH75_12985 [Flavonifractor plautii]|uniref:Uncharacterized protein n=1 Tax=Flavonifractor plautii TaxID=292800 RepID=A0AAX1KMK0_FLAPL|nr:hypothetical protein [Flavonifractor plautii]WAK79874.1 hypothetical protein [Flavonifractor phage Cormatin]ANU40241.1 hypothetical protein A4U99_03805 [Flavonifractor plautii]OXE47065.1 hypothetical protein ADH75_12985 [Flavonifractor plautii]QQR06989.1 hypothetical protein I5Q84_05765 [Flavonifractor plautii]UQA27760.1 hypothetical protein M2853_05795 [Flavonifractor plautii]